MKDFNRIGEDLFDKLRGRFQEMTIGDEEGNVTNEPSSARFFDFEYSDSGSKLGKVSVSIDEDDGLTVIYSRDFIQNEDEMTQKNWYNFLRELRKFSKKRLLNFDVRDINKSNLTKRDYKFLATNRPEDITMTESKLYGTGRISYQNIDNARLVIKHTESIDQTNPSARTRKIGSIYIESAEGERFKYPYKHVSGARAMARHVAEGGNPYDDFGSHITGLSEEMSKLRKFKNYMGRSTVMAESLEGYMDIVKERISAVKKTIESLQKPNYYRETFDSFETPMFEDVPEDVAENWIDQLTIRQFNEELADVFPYIYNLVKEGTKTKALGPEDLLGEAASDCDETCPKSCPDCGGTGDPEQYKKDKKVDESDEDLVELDIRTSKQFAKAEDYKNYEVYVSKQKVGSGYYMSYVVRPGSPKEIQTLRGQGPNPQKALAMSKEKIDSIEGKAERINSDATINLNVNFIKEELPQSTMTEPGDVFYAKLDSGPSLVIANENWGDDAKGLGFQKVAYKKLKSAEGVFSGGVFRMPSAVISSLNLVRHGRYLLGNPKRDGDENYVFPMSFHSIAAAPNDPLKLGKPALGVNPLRATESSYERTIENYFEDLMGQFSDVCEDCGNPSWSTFTEAEKQKGLDGKACWKGYRRQGTKMKGSKRVDNCVKVSEAEVGTVYMRFRERKTPKGETYLTAFAGFANSPEELQMDTASRKYMALPRKEDIVKAVKNVKGDKVFVGAKDITIFVDNPAMAKKYPQLGEALNMLEQFGKKQGITVEYKAKDPDKKSEKGSGKKRLPKGHAASADKNYKDSESERTTYFSINNSSLMKFLKTKAPSIMNSFRPGMNLFVMDQKEYRSFRNWLNSEAVVARFGKTEVRVDKEKSFSQDKGREFEGTEQEEQKTPLGEFILSYFDRGSGQFPKGETAILTMVEKDYGEEFIEPAKAFIEQINNKVAEVMGFREPQVHERNSEMTDISKLAGLK